MVFQRPAGPPGADGPTVDTVLTPGAAVPGGTLSGQVRITGGTDAFESAIEGITLELVAQVGTGAGAETGTGTGAGDGQEADTFPFETYVVASDFRADEGAGEGAEQRSAPFSVTLPWETPVNELSGHPLDVTLGIRTELAMSGTRERGGPVPLAVGPLPAQEAVLKALDELGFDLLRAGLERGRIGGTGQQLPFCQEIALASAPQYADTVDEIELTFLAHQGGMDVVLEADKRGGTHPPGDDALTRFTVPTQDVEQHDWKAEVDGWVRELLEHRAAYGTHASYGHRDPYAPPATQA